MEKQPDLKQFLSFNKDTMTRASSIRKIEEIASSCDRVPLAKLFSIMLRKRGEVQNDPFYWTDKNFLKKLEQYQREFSECYNSATGEFDLNEEYAG